MDVEGQVTQAAGNQGEGAQQGASGAAETQAPGWISGLPDNLKTNEAFAGFKTVGEFAQSHLETQGKVKELEGKLATAIVRPGEGATDEEKAAFREAMGIPDAPDKYEFERPQMPEGVEYNEALETWFRNIAHKHGLAGDTAKAMYADYMQFGTAFVAEQAAQRSKTLEDGMNKLKETWGNKYDENVATVKRVQEKMGLADEGMKSLLSELNLENDPRLITWMLTYAAPMYIDDNAPPGRSSGGEPVKEGMAYKVPNPPPT